MPNEIIPLTAAGWPYMDGDNYIDTIPSYTTKLATKLQNGEAAVPRAENAATRAENAANSIPVAGMIAVRMAAGRMPAAQATGTSYTENIVFPTGRFTVPPVLVAILETAAGHAGAANIQCIAGPTTTTVGQIIFVPRTTPFSNTWLSASWIAVQMTASSAIG